VKSVKVRGSVEGDIFVSERCELQAGCKNLSNYDRLSGALETRADIAKENSPSGEGAAEPHTE
jgi:hypothetical protein